MEITQEHDGDIQEIMREMQCPKGFECYKSGFENLCKVEIGVEALLIECMEEKTMTCKYGLPYGLGCICKCPLRNYIAKNFNK
jgi:hypothetical protein